MISDRLLISNTKRLLCIFISLLIVHSVIYIPLIVFAVNAVSESDNETNSNNYTVVDTYMTWREAKSYCESQDGHLVTITSDEEQSLVHSLIQGHPYGAWIGLSDERIEGTWEWVTGEKVTYTNWANEEPPDERNHAMMHDGNGLWDGPFETATLPFVCEWSDYQNYPPIVNRILLFLFFIGAFIGLTYYNQNKGHNETNFSPNVGNRRSKPDEKESN